MTNLEEYGRENFGVQQTQNPNLGLTALGDDLSDPLLSKLEQLGDFPCNVLRNMRGQILGYNSWGLVLKSGVTLDLDHIYFVSLFDLFALHLWVLVWVYFDFLPGSGTPFRYVAIDYGNCVGYINMVKAISTLV